MVKIKKLVWLSIESNPSGGIQPTTQDPSTAPTKPEFTG